MPEPKPIKLKLPAVPSSIGAAIDMLFKMRAERKRADAAAEQKKSLEARFEEEIFKKFAKADLTGARGKLAQATVERREYINMDDFDAFAKYVLKTKDTDLLRRQASAEAVKLRWASGKTVPGVGKFVKARLKLTATKSKK